MNKSSHENGGYSFFEDGKWFLVRCHVCQKENWAMAVASGECSWCGYNANKSNGVSIGEETTIKEPSV